MKTSAPIRVLVDGTNATVTHLKCSAVICALPFIFRHRQPQVKLGKGCRCCIGCSREVAEDFLRQNSSIDAVLLVTVDATRPVLSNKTSYTMRYDLVIAPSNARSPRMDTMAIASLKALLETATHCVPEPILNALNAAIRCSKSDFGPDMIGGYIMSNGNISLSSRALQRLLAGEITADEFINSHGWNDISGPSNPFVRMMRSGRMINKIEVESTDQDDDWLKFSFGSIDSAIAPFQVPLPEPSIESNDT